MYVFGGLGQVGHSSPITGPRWLLLQLLISDSFAKENKFWDGHPKYRIFVSWGLASLVLGGQLLRVAFLNTVLMSQHVVV